MGETLAYTILEQHLVEGRLERGQEIGIRVDQTLTQDATGTLAYLQFEAMKVPRVRTQLSVSYVDHNTLQSGFENADDHRYLQSVAAKYGILFSRPGNGICHQVHLERFAKPGATQLGSDSHTPTAGGVGALAIGVGGLDVAVAMAGGPFYLTCPRVIRVTLNGQLKPWCAAKDVILELLRRRTVKGGVGCIFEYAGPGLATLSVPERATITNMGAELGATTSIFPSDDVTREFFRLQERESDWTPLAADADASYDDEEIVELGELEPLVACPHSPDAVVPVRELEGQQIDQVCIGSCTNSSFRDLSTAAQILKGKSVAPNVSLTISPGSRQVFRMITESGALGDLVAAGARILECACGPCIGMGQSPPSSGVTLRSFNRNFRGRSGTEDAQAYLASVEVCAVSALEGTFADPRKLGDKRAIKAPKSLQIDDRGILQPSDDPDPVEIIRGPNIKPLPERGALPDELSGRVLLQTGDNVTTDHIMPAGAKILPLRSNIPAISEHVFERIDPTFASRAQQESGGFIVAGVNYGQGSSREHAALAPMYLGIRAVFAKSFARIHRSNLINFGILPLELPDETGRASQGDELVMRGVCEAVTSGDGVEVENRTRGATFRASHNLTSRERRIVLAGGLLNYTVSGEG